MSNMEGFMDFEERQMHDNKIKMYSLLMNNASELEHKYDITKLQLVENYVTLINYKRSLYHTEVLAVFPFKDLCKDATNYISKLQKKEITRRTKCGERDAYDQLMSCLHVSFGFEPKEITKITFEGYEAYKIWIYFTDKRTKEKLVLRVPNLKSSFFSIPAFTLVRLKENPSEYLDDIKRKVDALDTSVLGLLVQKQENSWYTVANFPDRAHSLSELGKTYYAKNLSTILDDILKETKK